jgi:hypothetical protein
MAGISMFFKKATESTYSFDVFTKVILDCWIGIIRSAVLSGKLNILENILHSVNLLHTSNLKVWFVL